MEEVHKATGAYRMEGLAGVKASRAGYRVGQTSHMPVAQVSWAAWSLKVERCKGTTVAPGFRN